LQKATIYLFDEPTNNLDSDAIKWLQQYITDLQATVFIISHDRDFLDALVTRILEIDPASCSLQEYAGNYSQYEAKKREQFNRAIIEYETQQEEIESLNLAIHKAKNWAKK